MSRTSLRSPWTPACRAAPGDDLIGVDALVGFATAGQLLDDLGDGGHTGGAAGENDVGQSRETVAGLSHDVWKGFFVALEQVRGQFSDLARVNLIQVDGAIGGHGGTAARCSWRSRRTAPSSLARQLPSGAGGRPRSLDRSAGLGLDLVDQPVDDR